jgi:AcrR family transcriptional regulator
MTSSPRPTLRRRQAEATRREIVGAARRLFAEHGFVDTSVAQIAEEAGVAVQTVYKSMGSKRALLMALVDAIDEEAELPVLRAQLDAADDGPGLVHGVVAVTRAFPERCGDIISALSSAARVDPDAAAALAEGERRHREGAAYAAGRLDEVGALRDGTSADDAAVLITLLTSRHSYEELVRARGWTFDAAARWVEDALTAQLLRS